MRETRIRDCERFGLLRKAGSSMNSWKFITRQVPKEARRAVNRWKSLNSGVKSRADQRRKSLKEVVPPSNSQSWNVTEASRRTKTYPAAKAETDERPSTRRRPRKIRALLSGTPQNKKLVSEFHGRLGAPGGKGRIPQGMWLVGISHKVNLEYDMSRQVGRPGR